ncbi:MAG TPA: polysaccharide deacetylase family protein [Bacteroidota bacterium]|nr:polysaccharide deacetylase family protein [Bacteroidota bacterium]
MGSKFATRLKTEYKKMMRDFPAPVRRVVGMVDYARTSRIKTYRDPVQHPSNVFGRGVVSFSLDFELAWAWQYSLRNDLDYVSIGLRERAQVPKIIDLLDAYQIPSTWATVGHLFLSSCTRDASGRAHPEIPPVPPFRTENWKYGGGDWFRNDPCTDLRRGPAWYAPDLIEKILHAKVRHEIGCHGFSHIGLGPYCPAEVVRAEVEACAAAMKPFGLVPTTLVFPGNSEGHYNELIAGGIRIVRSFPDPSVRVSLPLRRPDGLWAIPTSSALERGTAWTMAERLSRLKRYVDIAAEKRLSAHFWYHPSMDEAEIRDLLVPLLTYCAERRDRGDISVLTMRDMVAQMKNDVCART